MMIETESLVTHQVVIVKVNKTICQALLYPGAGSSYVSATLLYRLTLKSVKKETKRFMG